MRPKTKEEKELQGTFEPSKEPLESVELAEWDAERMPNAPDGWPPHMQKLWNDRCKDLKNTGYLTKAFIPLLRRYCFAILQAEKAEGYLLTDGFVVEERGTEGQVYEVMSKWINVLDNANKTIERIGAKFGFSPLDVQKIPAIQKKEGKEMSLLK
jgi:P27 family predicted phage terminase small subunit